VVRSVRKVSKLPASCWELAVVAAAAVVAGLVVALDAGVVVVMFRPQTVAV
jgi:hypothetical protein